MKEKPILMQCDMVTATLRGLKTHTRRLNGLGDVNKDPDNWEFKGLTTLGAYTKKSHQGRFGAHFHREKPSELQICPVACPWQIGQELWIRESFARFNKKLPSGIPIDEYEYLYKADYPKTEGLIKQSDYKWKPSIHMPRWASRIQLLIKDIRVERVQNISEEDAKAEGVPIMKGFNSSGPHFDKHKDWFRELWDSINAIRKDKNGNVLPYSWNDNPWVWVVEFERLT